MQGLKMPADDCGNIILGSELHSRIWNMDAKLNWNRNGRYRAENESNNEITMKNKMMGEENPNLYWSICTSWNLKNLNVEQSCPEKETEKCIWLLN